MAGETQRVAVGRETFDFTPGKRGSLVRVNPAQSPRLLDQIELLMSLREQGAKAIIDAKLIEEELRRRGIGSNGDDASRSILSDPIRQEIADESRMNPYLRYKLQNVGGREVYTQ